MGKVYVFLADGFEEVEALTPVDMLRRGGLTVVTVSVSGRREVSGSHGIQVTADCLFEEADFGAAAALVLPGGMPGTVHLEEHEALCALLTEMAASDTILAAICAAPRVLGRLGLLEGKTAVCYPGNEALLKGAELGKDNVAVDGRVVTANACGAAMPFALTLLGMLAGEETAQKVASSVLWK